MTSRSFDGEYIARFIQRFGFGAARGSSTRGGIGAIVELVKTHESWVSSCIHDQRAEGSPPCSKDGGRLTGKENRQSGTAVYRHSFKVFHNQQLGSTSNTDAVHSRTHDLRSAHSSPKRCYRRGLAGEARRIAAGVGRVVCTRRGLATSVNRSAGCTDFRQRSFAFAHRFN